ADLPKALQRDTRGIATGGDVRLMAPRPGMPLMLGTGIETSFAAAKIFILSAWVSLCDSGLKSLILSFDIRHIAIGCDRDLSGAGKKAADAALERWGDEGRIVEILFPSKLGTDFNDELKAKACR